MSVRVSQPFMQLSHLSVDQRISAREMGPVGCGQRGGSGQKCHFLGMFFMDEPIIHDLSRNLSCKNGKS